MVLDTVKPLENELRAANQQLDGVRQLFTLV